MQTKKPLRRNRVGIPAEVATVSVQAAYWAGDFKFTPTTTTIRFVKNR